MGGNVEIARRLHAAHRARDVDAVRKMCASDLEIHALIARLEGIEFRGPGAYRRFREFIDATWEGLDTELERVSEVDDERVMATIRLRAHSRGSEIPVDQRVVWVMTIREGKLARVDVHSSVQAAREHVGREAARGRTR